MPDSQVFVSHLDTEAQAAREIRFLIDTALDASRAMTAEESVGDSDVVLVLCSEGADRAESLHRDIEHARKRSIPIIPIVLGRQTLETLDFPLAEPVSTERGLEFHDQMFAIKLLLVVREVLGVGEPLAPRGSAPRA